METTIKKLRNRILEVAYRDEMGHIPSALSILDIVWNLYDKVITPDDQFILSKGHGVMALYAVLEEKGLMTWDTKLMGHPRRGGPILASTGSLGHGLPMAVGLALAKKIKGEKGRVFCLVGDGECNEGTTWESALLAAHHKLDNLILVVDQNLTSERALENKSLNDKFAAFGLRDIIINGHSQYKMLDAIDTMSNKNNIWEYEPKPHMILCETVKGNGVPFMQDPSWHNRRLNMDEYLDAIK